MLCASFRQRRAASFFFCAPRRSPPLLAPSTIGFLKKSRALSDTAQTAPALNAPSISWCKQIYAFLNAEGELLRIASSSFSNSANADGIWTLLPSNLSRSSSVRIALLDDNVFSISDNKLRRNSRAPLSPEKVGSLRIRSRPRQFDDIHRPGAAYDRVKPPRPCVQRMALLGRVVVAVIHGRDAFDRPALMVQHGLDDMRRNADARHAASGRAAKIMENPSRRRHDARRVRAPFFRLGVERLKDRRVDRFFCTAESGHRRRTCRRKDEGVSLVADARKGLENP